MDKPETKQRNHGRQSRLTTKLTKKKIEGNIAEEEKNDRSPVLINVQELMTLNDVAKKVGKSYAWILHCIHSGQLKAIKLSRRYHITPEQYEQWRKEYPNPRPGRPTNAERQRRKSKGESA